MRFKERQPRVSKYGNTSYDPARNHQATRVVWDDELCNWRPATRQDYRRNNPTALAIYNGNDSWTLLR